MHLSSRGLRRPNPLHWIRSGPALLGALALAACSSDATGPSQPELEPGPANQAPVVESIAVADDGYSKARLRGAVSDPDNDIASVVIDWGDGQTSTVSGDLSNISVQHRYDRAQDFTVTLNATDSHGVSVERSSSISINVPDPACLDVFKVVGACITVARDLRNFELEVRVANITVYKSEITDGKGDLRIPLGPGIGFLVVGVDMDAGTMAFRGEYCIIPYLKCDPIPLQTIELQT